MPRVLWFFSRFFRIRLQNIRLTLSLNLQFELGLHSKWNAILQITFFIWFSTQAIKISRVTFMTFERRTRAHLGTTLENFKITQDQPEYLLASGLFKYS
jgi:hypothetical protein